jgi:hypothetical protein
VTGVAELDDHRTRFAPHRHRSGAVAVPDAVGGQLGGGRLEVSTCSWLGPQDRAYRATVRRVAGGSAAANVPRSTPVAGRGSGVPKASSQPSTAYSPLRARSALVDRTGCVRSAARLTARGSSS